MAWILKMMLVLVIMDINNIYSDAKLTATITQRGSLVLECIHVEDWKWSAVRWFNSSTTTSPLILRRNDSDGTVKVFAESTSLFDKDWVNSSCSPGICILEIKLLPRDNNTTFFCSYSDDLGNETMENITLNVTNDQATSVMSAPVTNDQATSVTSAPVPSVPVRTDPGGQILSAGDIAGIASGAVIAASIIIIIIICCKRKTGKQKSNIDTDDSMELQTIQQVSVEEQLRDKIQNVPTDGVAERKTLLH